MTEDDKQKNENQKTEEIMNEDVGNAENQNSPETEEEIIEYEYNADGEEDFKATLKKLRKQLKDTQKEKQEYLNSWQRERADFLNYKKNESEQNKRTVAIAREQFAEELLPVLDAYDMAFANKEAWEKVDKNWRMGVEYIHQQLLGVLSENGIEEIPVKIGDKIDPMLHEAMNTVPTEEKSQDQTIAQIIQKGYKNGDRVFRPARVNVFELKN